MASNTRLLALCTLAVGTIYAASYVYTEPAAHAVQAAGAVTGTHSAAPSTQGSPGASSPAGSSAPGSSSSASTQYRNGTYSGSASNAYGTLSVSVTVAGGRVSAVHITSYSMHYPSAYIDPQLNQEVVQTQSYNVALVSGATASSYNFVQAVYNALQSAKG